MGNITFTMIKPEAVEAGNIGAILTRIEQRGFRIVSLKKVHLTHERAGEFYEIHKERPFYKELVEYMSGGPIIAAILEKDNAVADFRELIGSTRVTSTRLISRLRSAELLIVPSGEPILRLAPTLIESAPLAA